MSIAGLGATGPSDPGLAGERTSLAWARVGMSLLALPGAMLTFATGRHALAAVAAAAALLLGLGLVTVSVRRQRAEQGMVEHRTLRLASEMVLLTGCAVLSLCVCALLLVLD